MDQVDRKAGFDWGQYISPALDGLTVLAYIYFLPWLARSFLTPSLLNGIVVGGAFVLLLAAIYSLKVFAAGKIERKNIARRQVPPKRKKKSADDDDCCCAPWFYIIGVCFFYCGFLAMIFLDTTTSLDWNDAAFENWGAGLMFFGALAVLIAIVLPAGGEVDPKSPTGLLLHVISVAGIALMTIVGMAFWESVKLADPGGSPEQITGIWGVVLFLLMWLVFVGFLGPPRIYLHLIKGDKLGLATYLLSVGYYVWDMFEV